MIDEYEFMVDATGCYETTLSPKEKSSTNTEPPKKKCEQSNPPPSPAQSPVGNPYFSMTSKELFELLSTLPQL